MADRFLTLAVIAVTLLTASLAQAQVQAPMQDSVVKGFGDCCTDCSAGNYYFEGQIVSLEGHATEEDFDPSVEHDEGYRLIAGYESCDGLGLRIRYFDFDGAQAVDNAPALDGLELSYFDIEVTERFCLCNLNGVISAGYRHANYKEFDDNGAGDPDVDFDGDGVTFGIAVERDITCQLALYGWAQHSILFGDDGQGDHADTLMGWTEVQLGASYNTCIAGYNTAIRAGVEAQRHEGMGDNDNSDTGLIGWFLSAGVNY